MRIGIHLGDVVLDGDDIYGHGVNIAARLEALAPTGGICISSIVYESITTRIAQDFSAFGERKLKNISNPVHLYTWAPAAEKPITGGQKGNDKPLIAVLPFANMSEDPDQQYFSDGISEDIITGLPRF